MHFEHSSPLLFYKANSKETIPRRESVVKNNELGEDWGSVLPPKQAFRPTLGGQTRRMVLLRQRRRSRVAYRQSDNQDDYFK